jgi:hypothetical protein
MPAVAVPGMPEFMPKIDAADDTMKRIRNSIIYGKGDMECKAGPDQAVPDRPWQWDGTFAFRKGSGSLAWLTSGWSYPEDSHVWSDGNGAVMTLPQPSRCCEMLLDFDVNPFCFPPLTSQRIRVTCANRLIAESSLGQAGKFTVVVPRMSPAADGIVLKWEFPDAMSPMELGANADPRKLAIALRSLSSLCLG